MGGGVSRADWWLTVRGRNQWAEASYSALRQWPSLTWVLKGSSIAGEWWSEVLEWRIVSKYVTRDLEHNAQREATRGTGVQVDDTTLKSQTPTSRLGEREQTRARTRRHCVTRLATHAVHSPHAQPHCLCDAWRACGRCAGHNKRDIVKTVANCPLVLSRAWLPCQAGQSRWTAQWLHRDA